MEKATRTSGDKLGNGNSASQIRYSLADAVLDGQDENQIAEAIAFYRIITAVRMNGEGARIVARRLSLGDRYSSKKHLEKGWSFDLNDLQTALDGVKKEYPEDHDLHETIDECMQILRELSEPKQLNLPFAA